VDDKLKTRKKAEVKPMNQVLQTQLSSLISIDRNLRHRDFNQIESHSAPVKCSRSRGVFLSHQGWQKLVQAGVLCNEFGERFTYGQLSERSLLDERTISRLLICEVKVDKNTLKIFFQTFDLSLEAGDFTTFKSDKKEGHMETGRYREIQHGFSYSPSLLSPSLQPLLNHDILTVQRVEFEHIIEELTRLKQRLKEHDRLFRRLSLSDKHMTQQLRA
jgi:hypothetical protein